MSDFKFSCPVCGQNILCDTTHAGMQDACPGCRASITVPRTTTGSALAPGSPAPVTVPSTPTYKATSSNQKTSGLAIASLVCSLTSLVTCVGWIPGVICGHLARTRIRKNASLKGDGLALAGLVIGYAYVFLAACAATVYLWTFTVEAKHGFQNIQQTLATNNIVTVSHNSSTNAADDSQAMSSDTNESAITRNPPAEPASAEWTLDMNHAEYPDHPAGGQVRGADFTIKSAFYRNTELRLTSTTGTVVDILHLADTEGNSYMVHFEDDSPVHIRVTWSSNGESHSTTYDKGFGLRLKFDQVDSRSVSGRLYLCLSDDSKSCITGVFKARNRTPQKSN